MIITVENLTHRYGERTALAGLSFDVEEGALFGLLGPNGGGKSTLFRILSTMMAPSEGHVSVAGHDVEHEPDAVRREIGVVFQTGSVDGKLTVVENLTGQGYLYGLSGSDLDQRITDALNRLGIYDRRTEIVDRLSGGLRRRVEIAKALLHRPRVLLMDEPSTGLDPGARRELAGYIAELRGERRMTVLLTTHLLDEADRCDRLLLLHEGRRVAEGTPAELKARVGGDVVVLEVQNLEAMREKIGKRFGVIAHVIDGTLRVEMTDGHRFVTEVVETFPGEIESAALHKPTLEDVFLDETGVSIIQ